MRFNRKFKLSVPTVVGISLILLLLIGYFPLRIAISLHQTPNPQAILVLEGNSKRIFFAAQFWQFHRDLPVWVAGNDGKDKFNRQIFQQAGVPSNLVHSDLCSTDTVTNFTCLVQKFSDQGIQHVYLITSDYHMRRSVAISFIVFGSRGIAVSPVAVESSRSREESLPRVFRDVIRSFVWLATGRTGASLNPRLYDRP